MSRAAVHPSLADAAPAVMWTDRPGPAERPPIVGKVSADLCIVGGGYGGLWAAIEARRRQPERSAVLIDAGVAGGQASSRNGGFCSASLTHGLANGVDRFPDEIRWLLAEGYDNHSAIAAALTEFDIDCDWRPSGTLDVANDPRLVEPLREAYDQAVHYGEPVEWLDGDAVRSRLASPTYSAAIRRDRGESLVDPARLAWGLARAAEDLGAVLFERSPMVGLERDGAGVAVTTPTGTVHSANVLLATNAFRSPVRSINRTVVPVYDHVLATEPLTPAQWATVGWAGGEGVSDAANLFHYYRPTADGRIVWGGYDATYHFGSGIEPRFEQQDRTHSLLAEHFFDTFPQLEGLRFTHRWGGVIDTSSRFSVSFGTALDGRVAFAVGYTGLGVGATRWGSMVALDLLLDPDSPRLALDVVRSRPIPFPPEPLRWAGIGLTTHEIARADANGGRRGPWLRLLDRLGLGFDS